MTADKVTLRLNLLVTYLVKDEIKAVMSVADFVQALYREAQLVLRAVVGTRPLDKLLADKHAIGAEVAEELRARAQDFGLSLKALVFATSFFPAI